MGLFSVIVLMNAFLRLEETQESQLVVFVIAFLAILIFSKLIVKVFFFKLYINYEHLCIKKLETPAFLKVFQSSFEATIYVNTPLMAAIVLSSTVVVTKFLETCQLFSFLTYLNLQYPLNMNNYFNLLNIYNIDPIFLSSYPREHNNANSSNNSTNSNDSTNNSSNSSNLFVSINTKTRLLEEENKFDRIKYGERRFLTNSWIILVLNGGVFGFAILYSLLFYFLNLKKFHTLSSIHKILRWSLPITIFNITTLQLLFYLALELSKDFGWDSANSVIAITVIVFVSILLVYFYQIINKEYSNREIEKYYSVLFDGINTFFFIKRNYFFINLIRKVLVVAFITSITLDSKTQILGCLVTCLIYLAFILLARPFISDLEWIFSMIMELSFCFLLAVIYIYSYISFENSSKKIDFGYAIIISITIFMLAAFIFALIHIIRFVKRVYLIFKNLEKNEVLLTKAIGKKDESELAKIGHALKDYKKDLKKKKKVIVVYNKDKEERKRKKEEERVKQEELQNRLKDMEEEKKSRIGLQNIFTKQKQKSMKKKDSFMEEEAFPNDSEETKENNELELQEVIKNRMGEEKNKGLESIFNKQKNKSAKKKDSFEDEEEVEDVEGKDQKKKGNDINVEMQNFENLFYKSYK